MQLIAAQPVSIHQSDNRLPDASLILCSRNRPQLLADTVDSILAGDHVPTELIIVDDSDEPHPSLSCFTSPDSCNVRYLWTHSLGLSRANNDGVAVAQYSILVFTQDDMLVAPDWYATIVGALAEAGEYSVVTGQVAPTSAEAEGGFAPSTKEDAVPAVYTHAADEDILYVQNMALYRSALHAIGGFDERLGPGTVFPAAEDNDFAFRLLRAGYRILYVPQAVVYHRAWRSKNAYLPLRWGYGVARGGFYAKHLNLQDRHMLWRLIADIKGHLLSVPGKVVRQRQQAYGDIVLAVGILYGAIRWFLAPRKTLR